MTRTRMTGALLLLAALLGSCTLKDDAGRSASQGLAAVEPSADVAGSDADRDGVRDDVGRALVEKFSGSELRDAMRTAGAYQALLIQGSSSLDRRELMALATTFEGAQACLYSRHGFSTMVQVDGTIGRLSLNTPERYAVPRRLQGTFALVRSGEAPMVCREG